LSGIDLPTVDFVADSDGVLVIGNSQNSTGEVI
jgi:hypothetical protein